MGRRFAKRGMLGSVLLIVGFAGGWFTATVRDGYLVFADNPMALFGLRNAPVETTPQQLREQFGVFWEVWGLIEGEFYHRAPLDHEQMVRGAVKGLLASLNDQYTVYQEPDLAAQTNEHMQGTLEGIGAYVRIDQGRAYIDRPLKDSPALLAGLRQGDEVLQIDGVEIGPLIAGLDVNQAFVKVMARIRGAQGTTVTLLLRRGGAAPFVATLVRSQMIEGSVVGQVLDDGVAYIKISEFKATTTSEFDDALRALLLAHPTGLIFDLRNNPGGFLTNAREVLGRFYRGVALYQEDKNGTIEVFNTIDGPDDTRVFDMPLVVLINGGSASSSEIVAGALRDLRPHTILLGEKSFGKGSVQVIHALSDGGSARITVAHWLTPKRSMIHAVGIVPQFVVPYSEDASYSVPCIGERAPPAGMATCADNQLMWAISFLTTGQTPPVLSPTP